MDTPKQWGHSRGASSLSSCCRVTHTLQQIEPLCAFLSSSCKGSATGVPGTNSWAMPKSSRQTLDGCSGDSPAEIQMLAGFMSRRQIPLSCTSATACSTRSCPPQVICLQAFLTSLSRTLVFFLKILCNISQSRIVCGQHVSQKNHSPTLN